MRRVLVVRILAAVALALLLAGPSHAQGIVVAGGWAPSYLSGGGGSTTAPGGVMFNVAGSVFPFTKIVGDVGYLSKNGNSVTTGTVGIRVGAPTVAKVAPFVEGLVGVQHGGWVGGSESSFAYGVGVGVDFKVAPIVGFRFQANYFRTSQMGVDLNEVRLGIGISLAPRL
jgi:hypothetical protein